MSTICRYVLVDRNDQEEDHEYDSYPEAENEAKGRGNTHAVIERTYRYDDSELVWTPDGSDQWPPKPKRPSRTK
jgi:hypothetical protein